MKTLCLFLLTSALFAACQTGPQESGSTVDWLPPIETKADSLALKVFKAHGGPETWSRVQYVRFDFGRMTADSKTVSRRHLWDRFSGDYRLEWDTGTDSTVAVLFNVNTQAGEAFLNGVRVDSTAEANYVRRAYTGFINDTYWLLAPVKLLDPGVSRAYVPDSSDAEYDVITTSYDDVGLTPDDRFWFWIDKDTGLLARWAYVLQGRTDRPATNWMWMACTEFDHSAGPVVICPQKTWGDTSLMTDNVALPETVADDAFTRPEPML